MKVYTTGSHKLKRSKVMKPQIELSTREKIAVENILERQTQTAKHTITLSYLITKWSRFVTNVEKEYHLSIDDYTNSLSTRNLIQEILDVCPGNASLQELVSEWDNRFKVATEIVKEPLLPSLQRVKLGWWWFRVPKNPGHELKKWLHLGKM